MAEWRGRRDFLDRHETTDRLHCETRLELGNIIMVRFIGGHPILFRNVQGLER